MTFNELIEGLLKAVPAAVIGAIQWLTDALPVLLLWMTFIFTAMQMYVFVRDKLRRKAGRED